MRVHRPGRASAAAMLALLLLLGALPGTASAVSEPGAAATADSLRPILDDLGVSLLVRERPRWPRPAGGSVEVTLSPQAGQAGRLVVSFGLPFAPDVLGDDRLIRVAAADGRQIAAFTRPIAFWGIDGKKGSIRSVLVQLEAEFAERTPQNVVITWDRARTLSYLSGGRDAGLRAKIDALWPPLLRDAANSPSRKFNWRFRETSMLVWFLANAGGGAAQAQAQAASLREVNPPPAVDAGKAVAIVGAQLIDGRGGPAVRDATIVVRGGRIVAMGPRSSVAVPEGAATVDGAGRSVVPGLFDAHFHIERDYALPRLFLAQGVTSVRDPGQWLAVYDPIKRSELPQPRCFVAGPHLDCAPHAHPRDALTIKSAEETRRAVDRLVDEGASVIKVYYRLPPEWIAVACEAAHRRGVPVTAHLELVDADAAIRSGVDGIEHVTSFGTALAEPADAERFRAAVTRDNQARQAGRYELWSKIDFARSPRVGPLLELLKSRRTFVSPTLAVFEVRAGDRNATEAKVKGYANMLKFVSLCHRAGVPIVVGSHSEVPRAEHGRAYQREMELLAECGLTPGEVLAAATSTGARFFRVEDRLGTLEPGKTADLVVVAGDPLQDIAAMRKVERVMLNGRWVMPDPPARTSEK